MSGCNKRRFTSKEKAEEVIPQIQVLNMSKGKEHRNKRLHAYFCNCGYWHIGHKPRVRRWAE